MCCTEWIKRIGDGQEYDSQVPTKKKVDADPCLFGMYLAIKWNSAFDKQLGCATAIYSMHVVGLQSQSNHPQIRRIQELKKLAANPRVACDNYFYGGFINFFFTI